MLWSALLASGESSELRHVSLWLCTRKALSLSCSCVSAGAGDSLDGPHGKEILLSEDSSCRGSHMSPEIWIDPEAFPRRFGLVLGLSVDGGNLRGRGSGVPLWYIHCLSFVHPCGIWVCSPPVAGLRVNTQCNLDVSVMDTLIIPFVVLI